MPEEVAVHDHIRGFGGSAISQCGDPEAKVSAGDHLRLALHHLHDSNRRA